MAVSECANHESDCPQRIVFGRTGCYDAQMIFLALVTFEHAGDAGDLLPLSDQGACGWIAVKADDDLLAVESIRRAFDAVQLKVIEIDDLKMMPSATEVAAVDPHLAENIKDWEPGRDTVWGTIHCYVGDRTN